jgi:SAM-dependent methyltransferase
MNHVGDNPVISNIRGIWTGHALLAAHDLGLLKLLKEKGLTDRQTADILQLEFRGVRALLRTLSGLGIVELKNGCYFLTSTGFEAADQSSVLYGYLSFHCLLNDAWTGLSDRIRLGASCEIEPHRSSSLEIVRDYIKAMDALGRPVASDLAKNLNPQPGDSILDLGGGSCVHARAIIRHSPNAKVTVIERPLVIDILKETLNPDSNNANEPRLIAGDYLTYQEEEKHDLILLANIVHNENPSDIRRIFQNCSYSLKPGGRLAVLDYFASDYNEELGPSGFGMLIYLITPEGELYGEDELESMLEETGFIKDRDIQIDRYLLKIVKKNGLAHGAV